MGKLNYTTAEINKLLSDKLGGLSSAEKIILKRQLFLNQTVCRRRPPLRAVPGLIYVNNEYNTVSLKIHTSGLHLGEIRRIDLKEWIDTSTFRGILSDVPYDSRSFAWELSEDYVLTYWAITPFSHNDCMYISVIMEIDGYAKYITYNAEKRIWVGVDEKCVVKAPLIKADNILKGAECLRWNRDDTYSLLYDIDNNYKFVQLYRKYHRTNNSNPEEKIKVYKWMKRRPSPQYLLNLRKRWVLRFRKSKRHEWSYLYCSQNARYGGETQYMLRVPQGPFVRHIRKKIVPQKN